MSTSIGFREFDREATDALWQKILDRSYLPELEVQLAKANEEYKKSKQREGDDYRELNKYVREKEEAEWYWFSREFALRKLIEKIIELYKAIDEKDFARVEELVVETGEYLRTNVSEAHYGEYLHGQEKFVGLLLNRILGDKVYDEYPDVGMIPVEHWKMLLNGLTPELVNEAIRETEIDPELALDYLKGLKHVLKNCIDKKSFFSAYIEGDGDEDRERRNYEKHITEVLKQRGSLNP